MPVCIHAIPDKSAWENLSLKRNKTMSKSKAFTLIEILVVIAVITLLMALLLPALQRAKKQSKAVVCRSNLKQWGAAFALYTNNNDGLCPRQKFYGLATPDPWMHTLREHAGRSEGFLRCPMATKPADPVGKHGAEIISNMRTPNLGIIGGTFTAWGKVSFTLEGSRTPFYYGSYALNNWLARLQEEGQIVIGCGRGMDAHKESFWTTTDVGSASRIPLFADSWWWCTWVKDIDTPPPHEDDRTSFPCGCTNSIRRFCINRHDGFVNAAFLDGSAGKIGLKELWTLKWYRNFNTTNPWTRAGGAQASNWPEWMRTFKNY